MVVEAGAKKTGKATKGQRSQSTVEGSDQGDDEDSEGKHSALKLITWLTDYWKRGKSAASEEGQDHRRTTCRSHHSTHQRSRWRQKLSCSWRTPRSQSLRHSSPCSWFSCSYQRYDCHEGSSSSQARAQQLSTRPTTAF